MKFFVDTANVEDIKKANDMGVICGVTTNPSLIAKEGRDFTEVIKEITSIVDGPISGEVKATTVDAEGMIKEGREIAAIHPNMVVKIPIVDVDGEAVEADAQQGAGGHVDELDLGVGALVAQNVDVALDELAQTALLGALGAEDAVGLDDLEGVGELVFVGGVEAAQGQGQIIAQAHVGELFRVAGVQGGGELVAALEHFEDEVQVVAAVGLVEVLHILQHGGGDALEAGCAVSLKNFALNVVAQGLLVGQKVAHTF